MRPPSFDAGCWKFCSIVQHPASYDVRFDAAAYIGSIDNVRLCVQVGS